MMVFMPGLVFLGMFTDPLLMPSTMRNTIKVGRVLLRLTKPHQSPVVPEFVLEEEPACEDPDDHDEILRLLAISSSSRSRLDDSDSRPTLGGSVDLVKPLRSWVSYPRLSGVSLIYAFCSLRI